MPTLPSQVDVISRRELIRGFDYGPGQHVTTLGPTQRGKTTLALQLLGHVTNKDHKAVLLAGKPPHRDAVMGKAADRMNLTIVEEWPPTPVEKFKTRNKNGYVLRPHQTLSDLDADNENLRKQFRKALMTNYASKEPVITVVDEAHHVQNDLGLKKEYEAPLMRGAPHNAVWSIIQRGRFMTYLVYDAPEHLFIFYDPDRSNQKRYSEIGGVDPGQLIYLTENLKTARGPNGNTISECVYIRRSGPEIYIVGMT